MPELPEVETVATQLAPLLKGKVIESYKIFDKRLDQVPKRKLKKLEIIDVSRVAKEILIRFSSEQCLLVHLRMTGRLIFRDKGQSLLHDKKYLRFNMTFNRGALDFFDVRRFGTIKYFSSPAELPTYGLEPLSEQFSARKLEELLAKSSQDIKGFLLNQNKIVGIGNIYASEVLFASSISPFRVASSLNKSEAALLHKAIIKILQKAVRNCGTTFSDFQQASGEIGNYQRFLKVYQKKDCLCPRCKNPIVSVKQAGRSSFYCKKCQL